MTVFNVPTLYLQYLHIVSYKYTYKTNTDTVLFQKSPTTEASTPTAAAAAVTAVTTTTTTTTTNNNGNDHCY